MNYKKEMWEASKSLTIPEIKKVMSRLEKIAAVSNEFDMFYIEVNNHCWDIWNGFDHEKTRSPRKSLLTYFASYLSHIREFYAEAEKDYPNGSMEQF